MRIYLTSKEDIKSKTGQQYVKASFINPSTGVCGELFTSTEKFSAYKLPAERFVKPEELEDALRDKVDVSEVEFDQNGRLVSLK